MPALATLLPSARLQLPQLPFAQREERRFGQREEETGAGKENQDNQCQSRRHPRKIGAKKPDTKGKNKIRKGNQRIPVLAGAELALMRGVLDGL
jgi:hypothetical protein